MLDHALMILDCSLLFHLESFDVKRMVWPYYFVQSLGGRHSQGQQCLIEELHMSETRIDYGLERWRVFDSLNALWKVVQAKQGRRRSGGCEKRSDCAPLMVIVVKQLSPFGQW
jgi:hypothetical protein